MVLLHGLGRGWHAMEPLARALGQEGFSTLNIPYPSTRLPIPDLAERIRQQVAKFADDRPVHFVTHSLAGIIARALVTSTMSWKIGRIVMLAPPNGGSEIVDWSGRHPLLGRLLGPAGRSHGTHGLPTSLPQPPPDTEIAVIMGSRASIPVFRPLLEDRNDGIVSVSRGKIANLRHFAVIDADHTFIPLHPDALALTVSFLKSGEWAA